VSKPDADRITLVARRPSGTGAQRLRARPFPCTRREQHFVGPNGCEIVEGRISPRRLVPELRTKRITGDPRRQTAARRTSAMNRCTAAELSPRR
jgi:hypothetical protein